MKKISLGLLLALILSLVGALCFFLFSPEYHFAFLKGESMSPTIPDGALVCLESSPGNEIEIGQILAFNHQSYYGDDEIILHRIIEEEGGRFITKGDYNANNDFLYVEKEDIVGIYLFHVPLLGAVFLFLKENIWLVFIVAFLLVFLIIIVERQIISRRKKIEEFQTKA